MPADGTVAAAPPEDFGMSRFNVSCRDCTIFPVRLKGVTLSSMDLRCLQRVVGDRVPLEEPRPHCPRVTGGQLVRLGVPRVYRRMS
jgi:hypothetical protein